MRFQKPKVYNNRYAREQLTQGSETLPGRLNKDCMLSKFWTLLGVAEGGIAVAKQLGVVVVAQQRRDWNLAPPVSHGFHPAFCSRPKRTISSVSIFAYFCMFVAYIYITHMYCFINHVCHLDFESSNEEQAAMRFKWINVRCSYRKTLCAEYAWTLPAPSGEISGCPWFDHPSREWDTRFSLYLQCCCRLRTL